ncbi:hypothetical protein AU196_11250 [Mycobacterium sp. IS-1742]|uniref:DUF4395 domain-containing protein n=1 Tax=Mycobacterium sp. IS-1742 TaxID=1772285 RepID=UPI00073FD583|nr:DUF4395 domain-containing protein [Mycobacterium sp. IS-1742]KUI32891.1 hypothetical protein AU196_11250 [Mycobacterium sp. IS-1742]
MSTPTDTVPDPRVDVRGPRFTAWVTTGVLVATLVVSAVSPLAAAVLLGAQSVVFVIGALRGPRQHPYGIVFRVLVAPRLGPATDREPAAPLKFAQLVGLVFAAVGAIAFAADWSAVGLVFTAFALFAAFLNAAFGICLGCRLYPLAARLRRVPTSA